MSYYGSIDLISGLRPKNGGTFPLVNADDVYIDDSARLSARIPVVGTTVEWQAKPTFVPAMGQIVIWTDHGRKMVNNQEIIVPGIKVGNGNAANVDMAFVGDDVAAQIMASLTAHTSDTSIHVSAEDRQRWNNKVTTADSIQNETLELTRD